MNSQFLIMVWVSILLFGCRPNSRTPTGRYSQINLTNLVLECRQLAESGAQQNKERWKSSDPLPTQISSLSPQFVELLNQNGASVIDIQITGGFEHRGLLVVCQRKDPNFTPYKGRNWRITKIAPEIWEYKE